MPIYEYRCADCDKVFEISSDYKERENIVCPFCKGHRLVNIISKNIWVKYKGNGFTKKVNPSNNND